MQVLKFLMENNTANALPGQITIGNLILQVFHSVFSIYFLDKTKKKSFYICGTLCFLFLKSGCYQDCAVGLLFALLPVLGGSSGVLQGVISMTKLSVNFQNTL